MMRVSRALTALLLAAGCGTGTDGKPVAPPTSPAPSPVPPPESAVAQIMSMPGRDDNSYDPGDVIVVLVDLDSRRNVTVEGSPRLAIQIGEQVRLADFLPWPDWPSPRWGQKFHYEVRTDDLDADGISIDADALDFSEGAFVDHGGVEIDVEIRAVTSNHVNRDHVRFEPGEPLDTHRVLGWPDPRVCTDERERARSRNTNPILIDEWDGTPFRFYFDEGIPASERADAEHFFGVAERLSERIEAQLGYSILEVAGWIPEAERGFRIGDQDVEDCVGVRPGGIVVTVIPAIKPSGAARSHCGVFYWANNDIDTAFDGTMAHELFHLFGFGHSLITHPQEEWEGGLRMSVRLTNGAYTTPRHVGVTFEDVDALGCAFPHPDFPR